MAKYTYLGGSTANFNSMIQRFGVVTVMNADVYPVQYSTSETNTKTPEDILDLYKTVEPLCHLDTLKIANVPVEGPEKTVTGGQYSNALIKFGKSARLEIQDALGNSEALDALCGTITVYDTGAAEKVDNGYDKAVADKTQGRISLNIGENFVGEKCIIGDSFFIDQKSGQQVPVKIIFYNFLSDSLFNLTQDAEGDATVFDMNGDLKTTVVKLFDRNGKEINVGLFYSILDGSSSTNAFLTIKPTASSAVFEGMPNNYKVAATGYEAKTEPELGKEFVTHTATFTDKKAEITGLKASTHYDYVILDEKDNHIKHGTFETAAK